VIRATAKVKWGGETVGSLLTSAPTSRTVGDEVTSPRATPRPPHHKLQLRRAEASSLRLPHSVDRFLLRLFPIRDTLAPRLRDGPSRFG